MSDLLEIITDETDEITEQLLALFSAASSDDSVALVRGYLEEQLDLLEIFETDFYDFMSESALLASQRMQDMRLEIIELRLDQLENPEFNLREIAIDIALLVAIELAIIMSPHLMGASAIGAFGLIIANLSRSRSLQRTTKRFRNKSRHLKDSAQKSADKAYDQLEELRKQLDEAEDEIQAATQSFRSYKSRRRNPRSLIHRSELKRRKEAVAAAMKKRGDLWKKNKALIEEARSSAAAIAAIDKNPDLPIDSFNKFFDRSLKVKTTRWKNFWENAISSEFGSTLHGRAAEEAGAIAQDLRVSSLKSDHDTTLKLRAYSPTEIVGDYLYNFRSEKREARIHYAALKNQVRYSTPTGLSENEGIAGAFRGAPGALSALQASSAFLPVLQQALIEGIEFTLWAHWLSLSGALEIIDDVEIRVMMLNPDDLPYFSGSVLGLEYLGRAEAGAITQGMGLLARRRANIRGKDYRGLGKINENLSEYFFQTFSKHYLQQIDLELPFDYDPSTDNTKFGEALGLSKTSLGLFNNHEREQRIGKMTVINIHVFRHFIANVKAKKTLQMFSDTEPDLESAFYVNGDRYPSDPMSLEYEHIAQELQKKTDQLLELSSLPKKLEIQNIGAKMLSLVAATEAKIGDRNYWMTYQGGDNVYVRLLESEIETNIRELEQMDMRLKELEVETATDPNISGTEFTDTIQKLKDYKQAAAPGWRMFDGPIQSRDGQ